MALRILAGWDFAKIGTNTIRIVETTGTALSYSISYSTGTYCHESLSSVLTGLYSRFSTKLQSDLNTVSASQGHSYTFTVTYSSSAYTYTINANNFLFNLFFDGTSGTDARHTIGFTGSKTGASLYTSDARPYYVIGAAVGARSRVKRDYEPPGLVSGAISAGGTHYAIAPQASIKQYDFTTTFETATAVFKASAVAAVPWTYEHLWEHCRSDEPLYSHDGTEGIVHYMRPDGAHFDHELEQPDWDMWHINFLTYLKGRI